MVVSDLALFIVALVFRFLIGLPGLFPSARFVLVPTIGGTLSFLEGELPH